MLQVGRQWAILEPVETRFRWKHPPRGLYTLPVVVTFRFVPLQAADFVLMKSNLEDVMTAIDLSKKTFNRIRLNYVWAFGEHR